MKKFLSVVHFPYVVLLAVMAFVVMSGGCGGDTVYVSSDGDDYPGNPPDADFAFLEGSWELRDLNTVYMDNPIRWGSVIYNTQLLETTMDIHIISIDMRVDEDFAAATITLRDKFIVKGHDEFSGDLIVDEEHDKVFSFDTVITGGGNFYFEKELLYDDVIVDETGIHRFTDSFSFGISIISDDVIRVSEFTQRMPLGGVITDEYGTRDYILFDARFRMERK